MSSRFNPVRTNRVPWCDVITLIGITRTKDSDGYTVETETENEEICTFIEGVSRTEFYEALKAGIKCSAEVELWQDDYNGQEYAEFNSKRYKVIRSYETGRGTVYLSLSEELR